MDIDLTPYHAKYLAHELTRRYPGSERHRLAQALVDARVEALPHQVDAALFAFRSPLAKGALLADEVGLGKTIEAGLVISQYWAERKRRILVITPANLRKQWLQELQDKFFLDSAILERKTFDDYRREHSTNPFVRDVIIICSYNFANQREAEIEAINWDLVVMDEAHRLRNVYKKNNVMGRNLKRALSSRRKLLLTATPLQNSLLELHGLVSFIDEQVFGDLESFREAYGNLNDPQAFNTLRARLSAVCKRTLRSQVQPYVKYTERKSLLEEFRSTDAEKELYQLVSAYLQRPNLAALPSGQRQLLTLVLRKLLASSTRAIAGALDKMARRLEKRLEGERQTRVYSELAVDYEGLDETADELDTELGETELIPPEARAAIEEEIRDLRDYHARAITISENAKGQALLIALQQAFAEVARIGAQQKAIIFTESTRTQRYLLELLSTSPFSDGIVLFNGSNTDKESNAIYRRWRDKYQGTDQITGSKTADMRAALVEYFRDEGQIMIATEAGAEGINLQFCSLVINYDLPWNPQRIEQRIGRCHRYGQKHDVVVLNFLDQENEADRRVYELLDEKFRLFSGVFGASDEVLGAIESGVDLEKRIADIYQTCKSSTEIQAAFDELQASLQPQIDATLRDTRQKLLQNFDMDVTNRLAQMKNWADASLSRIEANLLRVTEFVLNGNAEFHPGRGFTLKTNPFADAQFETGLYTFPKQSDQALFYRLAHPLAEAVLARARALQIEPAIVSFKLSTHEQRVAALDDLLGQAGWLHARQVSLTSADEREDYLLLAAVTDQGIALEPDRAARFFTLGAEVDPTPVADNMPAGLDTLLGALRRDLDGEVEARLARYLEDEVNKLDGWADDSKYQLEAEIKSLDREIKEARRAVVTAQRLPDKMDATRRVNELEKTRNEKRRALFEEQDKIDAQRDELLANVTGRLQQRVEEDDLFTLRWRIE